MHGASIDQITCAELARRAGSTARRVEATPLDVGSFLVIVAVLAMVGIHAATWVPDEAVLRRRALELGATPISAARRGALVRIEGVVVGPALGEPLEAPVGRAACVAYALDAEGLAPLTRSVDFVIESEGAHARVTATRLELGIAGEPHGRRASARLDALLREHAPSSDATHAVVRVLSAGQRVAVLGYVAEREPDPDAAPLASGRGYRELVRPTRPVIVPRGMAVLVVEPPSSAPDVSDAARSPS